MLKRIFEVPRYAVAAVGGLVAIQGVIFSLIDFSLFSFAMTLLGLATVVGGLHVEALPVMARMVNKASAYLARATTYLEHQKAGRSP